MDLISREAVKNITYHLDVNFANSFDPWTLKEVERLTENLPSAFEGMTNRDVLKALFPIDENKGTRFTKVYLDHEPIESFALTTTQKWLDSPYKGVSE